MIKFCIRLFKIFIQIGIRPGRTNDTMVTFIGT